MFHVKSGTSAAFFVDGPGGTGKTFLYGALYAKVCSMGKICLPAATSGIAASNLPTGRTAHTWFKIPLDTDENLTCDIPKQGSRACLLREASLLIWDEASMAKKEDIEAVNLLLQDVCSNSALFGDKIIVFGGDFRQVLHVLPRRTQQEAVDASIVSSTIWSYLKKYSLTQNIRARTDPMFCDFLLRIEDGLLQSVENGTVKTDPMFCDFLLRLGDGLLHSVENGTVKLTPQVILHHDDSICPVELLVGVVFPQEISMFTRVLTTSSTTTPTYMLEFLNTLCPPGMTSHELVVKENSPVILLRNIDPAAGLCNGTRLICKRFFPNMMECEISSGYYIGERVFLPRITLKPSKGAKFPINFQRKQFPIKLSSAMTINKSQGQTLQRVGVYLPTPCFSHGQLYVALSRATTTKRLAVLHNIDVESPGTLGVKNVVSFEMLRRAGIGML